MEQIYENNLWGGVPHQYYSGWGSHDEYLVQPYVDTVSEFLKSFDVPLTICDLGCGDFNVGQYLLPYSSRYTAVDIAENLIEHNQSKFTDDVLEFQCLDIATQELPPANCALLRQVLQHLSNTEVQQVVAKLGCYQYLILTEHLPSGHFVPNRDIISGQGIRLKKQSGLDLRAAPFGLEVKREQILLTIELNDNKEKIVTTLYQLY